MSLTLFITLLTILSTVSSLVTQGLKTIDKIKDYPTIIVAVVAAVVGWGGGIAAYFLLGVPFDTPGIISLILLAPACWLTATLGYDKVMEVIKQLTPLSKKD